MERITKIVTSTNRKKGGHPRLAWVVFSGADNVNHAIGLGTEYRRVLQSIDQGIGKYVNTVTANGDPKQQQRHTFAVVTDHGVASVDIPGGGNLDLCDAFKAINLRAWRGDSKTWSGKFDVPLDKFGSDKDVLIGVSGDMSASVYVRDSLKGWKHRVYEQDLRSYPRSMGTNRSNAVDLIQTVLDFRGVQLVAWSRENGIVAIQTRKSASSGTTSHDVIYSDVGVAKLEKDGKISYQVDDSENKNALVICPLGYNKSLADGEPRTPREWLASTVDTSYPYAVVRLLQYFTVPGLAPDMLVTAHEGFDFGKDWEYYVQNFAGGHGGIHRSHLSTPAIFSGAGVHAHSTVNSATIEDLGESLRVFLGMGSKEAKPSLDFLDHKHDDIIATSLIHNNKTYAEDLIRGSPLSCVYPVGSQP